jgi:cytochrome P450
MHAPAAGNTIPGHVAADRIVDFDFCNDRRYVECGDIHTGLARLAAEAPGIFYTSANGGHWTIISRDLLFAAVQDTETFSNRKMSIPAVEPEPRLIPATLDPPQHGLYRMPLAKLFAPQAMKALQGEIRALAVELIDEVQDRGECDFVPAVAEPLPVMIFMRLMGMPLARLDQFRVWIKQILSSSVTESRNQAFANVAAMMAGLIAERRARPENDLISCLIATEIGGRPTTDDELQAYCVLLFLAGLDTVTNGMAFGVRHLSRDIELQGRLRIRPDLIPSATEEMLRRYTFTMPVRIVTRDTEFGGVQLKKDERVLLALPAADLDPKTFPEPTRFDLERHNKAHMAFNAGPHRCLGAHLARIELHVLYEEWLKRIPTFSQDPVKPERFRAAQVLAVESLPLVWNPHGPAR